MTLVPDANGNIKTCLTSLRHRPFWLLFSSMQMLHPVAMGRFIVLQLGIDSLDIKME